MKRSFTDDVVVGITVGVGFTDGLTVVVRITDDVGFFDVVGFTDGFIVVGITVDVGVTDGFTDVVGISDDVGVTDGFTDVVGITDDVGITDGITDVVGSTVVEITDEFSLFIKYEVSFIYINIVDLICTHVVVHALFWNLVRGVVVIKVVAEGFAFEGEEVVVKGAEVEALDVDKIERIFVAVVLTEEAEVDDGVLNYQWIIRLN